MPVPMLPHATRRQLRRERTLAAVAAILDSPGERAARRLAASVAGIYSRSLAERLPPADVPATSPERA